MVIARNQRAGNKYFRRNRFAIWCIITVVFILNSCAGFSSGQGSGTPTHFNSPPGVPLTETATESHAVVIGDLPLHDPHALQSITKSKIVDKRWRPKVRKFDQVRDDGGSRERIQNAARILFARKSLQRFHNVPHPYWARVLGTAAKPIQFLLQIPHGSMEDTRKGPLPIRKQIARRKLPEFGSADVGSMYVDYRQPQMHPPRGN